MPSRKRFEYCYGFIDYGKFRTQFSQNFYDIHASS